MTTSKNKPTTTLRDGAIKATIWKNQGEKDSFYSVEFSRTYQDQQGNYQDSRSFSGTQLLRLARLANLAYDEIAELRSKDREDSDDADNGDSS